MASTHHFDISKLFGVKGKVAVITGGMLIRICNFEF